MMKVELHCHLDGSLNTRFVDEMLREQGEVIPHEELEQRLRVRNDCTSLTEYLEKLDLEIKLIDAYEKPFDMEILSDEHFGIPTE